MTSLQDDWVKIPGSTVHKPGNKVINAVKKGIANYTNYLSYNDNKCRRLSKISVIFLVALLISAVVYAVYVLDLPKLGRRAHERQALVGEPLITDHVTADHDVIIGEVSPPLSENVLSMMNNTELYHYYRGLISLLTYRCHDKQGYGTNLDLASAPGEHGHHTQWMVCQDEDFELEDENCLVYSFGLNWDFAFEDDVADKLGCEVFVFDPSHGERSADRPGLSRYFPVALQGIKEDAGETWRVKTFSELLEKNNHEDENIDLLKLDLDGNEWAVLDHLIYEDRPFRRVRQLAVGVNLYKDEMTAKGLRERIVLLETLTKLGMRLYDVQDLASGQYYNHRVKHNMTCCSTLHFVNTKHRDLIDD